MKFYVASKTENVVAVQRVIREMMLRKHQLTYDWTVRIEMSAEVAALDMQGVRDADFVIGIFESPAVYKGAIAEIGMALALHKMVIIVGHQLDNMIFMKLPQIVQFDDVDDMLDKLRILPPV